mmetsp:Transcript_5573/g.6412  ORF Transcript_5573/g.6412 Transcript_5573/m.6412 type:complete len:118 (-) Transcript_5573:400-753(-)|eukprot:CAMPEP_0197863308 /NCGR_PEP_ID=MMETSP1438-20131217/40646_1 /TAXON_ID=1461541 /ORGANISM="Pterosperma sp., Strain CCMP1384" /LENGTH=117 /DNA_ID=CAMNT_0043481147 /DNA_START=316 /DNA_END=669 /DNA_ORIENTATION=-
MGCSDSKPAEGGSGAPAEEAALPEKLPHMSHLVKGGAETKKAYTALFELIDPGHAGTVKLDLLQKVTAEAQHQATITAALKVEDFAKLMECAKARDKDSKGEITIEDFCLACDQSKK